MWDLKPFEILTKQSRDVTWKTEIQLSPVISVKLLTLIFIFLFKLSITNKIDIIIYV